MQLSNLGSNKIHTQLGVFVNTQMQICISQQERGEELGTCEFTHTSHICHVGSLTKAIAVLLYDELQETNSSFKSKGRMITEQGKNTSALQTCYPLDVG